MITKDIYEEAQMDVVVFDAEDIITTSALSGDDIQDDGNYDVDSTPADSEWD
ncbi:MULTISPECIES: hypothetical protein [unclassified Ruminococcus]|uniref:hypothetical protein n=1 Tax=unclassified Ruminococcus TaxID=2608920 RepID=UPI00210B2108|nr:MULTISPECIES: hypothetical protein [unclassified Ruminococcus]MCQ4021825.1 hypothetical protein [Ruminococcus sp. zg-924]MCQ4114270.1 hypothetical protein [Ruminococcus sp. zg-921]